MWENRSGNPLPPFREEKFIYVRGMVRIISFLLFSFFLSFFTLFFFSFDYLMMLAIYIYTLASLLDSRLHPRGFMYNINTDQWVEEETICKQVISGVFCTADFDLPNRDMEYETLLLHKCICLLLFYVPQAC